MGVRDDGGQRKLEVLVVRDDVLAELDHEGAARILVHLVGEHRVQEGVEGLEHVLEQHGLAQPDRHLEGLHLLFGRVGGLHCLDLVFGARELQEAVGLRLRVDHEGPPLGDRHDDAVLHAEGVGGQPVDVPLPDLHGVTQDLAERALGGARHVELLERVDPRRHERLAVGGHKGAQVGDGARADQDVAHQALELLGQHLDRLLPRLGLAAEAGDELIRVGELDGRALDLRLEGRHLLDRGLQRRL